MRKFSVRRRLSQLAAWGAFLLMLAPVRAAAPEVKLSELEEGVPLPSQSMQPQVVCVPETTQEDLWERAVTLLTGRSLTQEQAEALFSRLTQDSQLLERLEWEKPADRVLACLSLPSGRAELLDRYRAWTEQYPEESPENVVLQVNMDADRTYYENVRTVQEPDSLMVLANKHNALPKDYVPELEALEPVYGGGELRPEAAQAFRLMADAAREEGVSLCSVSAYRSYKTQISTYGHYLRQYRQETVDTFSARAGHSEHQTGLALDINTASSRDHFETTEAFAWLQENCTQYGFILRYGQGKEHITGYRFEPWHYRYVGVETAQACMDQGLAFEEYLALLPCWGPEEAEA